MSKYINVDGYIVEFDDFIILGKGAPFENMVNSQSLSRAHLYIYIENNKIYVKDLGSKNGTFLDKQKLEPGEAYKVNSSSRLLIGDHRIIFPKNCNKDEINDYKDFHSINIKFLSLEKLGYLSVLVAFLVTIPQFGTQNIVNVVISLITNGMILFGLGYLWLKLILKIDMAYIHAYIGKYGIGIYSNSSGEYFKFSDIEKLEVNGSSVIIHVNNRDFRVNFINRIDDFVNEIKVRAGQLPLEVDKNLRKSLIVKVSLFLIPILGASSFTYDIEYSIYLFLGSLMAIVGAYSLYDDKFFESYWSYFKGDDVKNKILVGVVTLVSCFAILKSIGEVKNYNSQMNLAELCISKNKKACQLVDYNR